MFRIACTAVLGLLLACQPPSPDFSSVFDGSGGAWVDLTHAFSESTIYWPTDTLGFQFTEEAYGQTEGGWFYASYSFGSAEHGGTHLDAPIHFAEGRRTTDEIPLSGLIGPAAVIDVSGRATPDYLVTIDDLTTWEREHGVLPDGAMVLLRTGWSDRWDDRTAYLGTDLTGSDAVPELHFPGLAPEAAQWLVDTRSIAGIGIDTPSIDYGQSADFQSHVALYSANISGFENVANLDQLPATGAFVVALPMKIEGGSGGPLRIVAFVPDGP
jgi:kynurenine formamidase